jgi:hypothetical protein
MRDHWHGRESSDDFRLEKPHFLGRSLRCAPRTMLLSTDLDFTSTSATIRVAAMSTLV